MSDCVLWVHYPFLLTLVLPSDSAPSSDVSLIHLDSASASALGFGVSGPDLVSWTKTTVIGRRGLFVSSGLICCSVKSLLMVGGSDATPYCCLI